MAFKDENGNTYESRTAYAEDVFAAEKRYTELSTEYKKAHAKELAKENSKKMAKGIAGSLAILFAPLGVMAIVDLYTDWCNTRIRKKEAEDRILEDGGLEND